MLLLLLPRRRRRRQRIAIAMTARAPGDPRVRIKRQSRSDEMEGLLLWESRRGPMPRQPEPVEVHRLRS